MYRPKDISGFVGQERLVEQVHVTLEAARRLHKPLPHILIYGPRGTGKTTVAHIIANEAEGPLVEVSPFTLKTEDDVFRMFNNNLAKGVHTVFLIDEIHRLPDKVAEMLYQPMERYTFIRGGRRYGPPMRYTLVPFTVLGATTNPGALPEPFRDRFGMVLAMDHYTQEEMAHILKQAAAKQDYPVSEDALMAIVKRSRNNPRLANTYLDRCNDYRVVSHSEVVDLPCVEHAFERLQIDEIGLTQEDMRYLKLLNEAGRPVGLNSLETAMGLDGKTLQETIEPFLIQKGMVIVTPSGRTLTDDGVFYFTSKNEDAGVEPDAEYYH